jgi:hypothetical protein
VLLALLLSTELRNLQHWLTLLLMLRVLPAILSTPPAA